MFLATKEEALRLKSQFEKEIAGPPLRTIGEVIEAFIADRTASGDWRPITAQATRDKLVAFFAPAIEADIAQITARRAAALYRGAAERVTRFGRPASASTHRLELRTAKRLFRWAMRKGLVASNPFVDVDPVGRVNVGKKQLRLDEARAFADTALRMWSEKRDELALAAACALFMGMRASEILGRSVRDLDAGGAVLVIESGKTKNAARSPKVPAALRPHLLDLAGGAAQRRFYLVGRTASGGGISRCIARSARSVRLRVCRSCVRMRCAAVMRALRSRLGRPRKLWHAAWGTGRLRLRSDTTRRRTRLGMRRMRRWRAC